MFVDKNVVYLERNELVIELLVVSMLIYYFDCWLW